MAKDIVVDTKQLKRDIKKAQRRLDTVADQALNKVLGNKQSVYMSFDEIEAIPYSAKSSGTITFSGSFEAGSTLLEDLLTTETQDVLEATVEELNKGIRGLFK